MNVIALVPAAGISVEALETPTAAFPSASSEGMLLPMK
jgi:hypothetical protein